MEKEAWEVKKIWKNEIAGFTTCNLYVSQPQFQSSFKQDVERI